MSTTTTTIIKQIQARIERWTKLANNITEARCDMRNAIHCGNWWCRLPEHAGNGQYSKRAAWIKDVCTSYNMSPVGHHLFVHVKIPSKHGNNEYIYGDAGRCGYKFDCLELFQPEIEQALKMDPKTGEAIGHARLIKVDGITIDIDEFCK